MSQKKDNIMFHIQASDEIPIYHVTAGPPKPAEPTVSQTRTRRAADDVDDKLFPRKPAIQSPVTQSRETGVEKKQEAAGTSKFRSDSTFSDAAYPVKPGNSRAHALDLKENTISSEHETSPPDILGHQNVFPLFTGKNMAAPESQITILPQNNQPKAEQHKPWHEPSIRA